jgi:uncharacterized protein with von Willebrand factor type A (vWA) domain
METKLLGFIQTLRQHQVSVSTAESLDAMRTLALIGYEKRTQLKDALSLVLAKTPADKATFNQAFDLYFSGSRLKPQHHDQAAVDKLTPGLDAEKLLAGNEVLANTLSSPLSQLLLDNTPLNVATAIAIAATDSGLPGMRYFTQKGQFSRRVMQQLGNEQLQDELRQLQTLTDPAAQALYQQLDEKQLQLREQVRNYVEEQFLLTANAEGRALQENALKQARLSTLEQRHFDEVRRLVTKLAKKLAARHSRRPKVERSGRLDVAKTLRKNIRHDSILFETHWRKKRKQPAQIFVLCDVSGSVSAYAKFLLLFLYSLNEVLPKIRSFCFSNKMGEVTELFNENDVADAIAQAMRLHGMGGSDYGRSLLDFEQHCLNQLSSNSTVIILGDGRNNQADPRLDILKKVYLKARRVIWLNPESRANWGSGDSEMLRYQSACHQVFECQSLQQLERFVDQLLRQSR